MLKPNATDDPTQPVRLALVSGVDLPLLTQFVCAYYVEDRHAFDEARQPAALAALAQASRSVAPG